MLPRDVDPADTAVAGGTVVVSVLAIVGAAQTDYVAPILTFTGAILVALITAHTANRRQQRALEAEAARHRETLEAERQRLTDQLDAEALRHRERLDHERRLAGL